VSVDEADEVAQTAAPLVAQALSLCEAAGLEMATVLLTDALDVLTYPDDDVGGE